MKLLLIPLFATQIGALVFNVPSNPVSGEETSISWTNDARDYTPWSIFLMNASETAFGLKGFLAHEVDASALSITLTLPVLPETEYRYILKGVRSDNVDWPVGWSPVFDILSLGVYCERIVWVDNYLVDVTKAVAAFNSYH